jgi:hypothetical protein
MDVPPDGLDNYRDRDDHLKINYRHMKTLMKICTLIAILTFISCDHYLDVEPKGKIIPKTIKDYDLLLNGGWANIYKTSDIDPLCLTADDFISRDKRFQLGDIDAPNNETVSLYKWDKNLFTNNNSQNLWNLPYENIFTYNLVIENTGGVYDKLHK